MSKIIPNITSKNSFKLILKANANIDYIDKEQP